jgi:hypothetical protein
MAPDKLLAQPRVFSSTDQYESIYKFSWFLHKRTTSEHHTSGTNKALLGPVAFCIAMRMSSSVTSSQGSTPYNRQILDTCDNTDMINATMQHNERSNKPA